MSQWNNSDTFDEEMKKSDIENVKNITKRIIIIPVN